MFWLRRRAWLALWLLLGSIALPAQSVLAQFNPFGLPQTGPKFDLDDTLQLNEVASTTKKQFEQARAFLANEQWSDAIDILRRSMESHGDKVVAVDKHRFLNVRDYCQLQLTALPPPGLKIYRSLADPQAKQWYETGVARRDMSLLEQVTEQAFASSWGDDALFIQGELALETGDLAKARSCWMRLLAEPSRPEGQLTRLVYPDTDLPLADIHARLVLVSLLMNQRDRAQLHLQHAGPILASATGRLAGRTGNFSELLTGLFESVVPEPSAVATHDWPTFAGAFNRQHLATGEIDIGPIAWQQSLRHAAPPLEYKTAGPRRVADDARRPLSYHPLVIGNRVFVLTKMHEHETPRANTEYVQDLQVFDLATGKPAWGESHLPLQVGLQTSPHHTAALGIARYTLSAHGNKLFARIGNPVTSVHSQNQFSPILQSLVCLDIEQEGKVLWSISPPGEVAGEAAFEGAPVCDGAHVYIGVRTGNSRQEAHVACYDSQTGQLRWQRLLASADTPGQGAVDEITHNLLTLDGGRLYCNTNLGAVVALDARDGRVLWAYRYSRLQERTDFDAPLNFSRDVNPCVVYNGRVFAAPSDTNLILALDAEFGELCWPFDLPNSVVHLLGVVNGLLVASGDALQFFRAEPRAIGGVQQSQHWQMGGKLIASFADGEKQIGFGRGVIVGDQVYFPTRDKIWVFDTRGDVPRKVREIELPQTRGAKSGNLVVANGYLLIATNDELYAFEQVAK